MAAEKILVVDGDTEALTLALSLLRSAGFDASAASSALTVLDEVSSTNCTVLVADPLTTPALGPAFLENMRAQHPAVPVIVVTADNDVPVVIETLSKGAFDYVLKPFTNARLTDSARRAVSHGLATREELSQRLNLEQLVAQRTHMLRQAVTDLERSYDITLEALGDALDLKDAETEGHSKRVTAYTIALARAMGVKGAELRIMARGAFLHDIGKMAIPDAILLKPGKLNDEERSVMREHCLRGYLIVKKIPYLKDAAEIVYSHQEHYDGTGYPRSLRGEEIPLGARIFAIADTLDAITSDRPYRLGKSFAHASDEIARCGGTQFDPAVVELFRKLPTRIWEDLREEILRRGRSLTLPPTPLPGDPLNGWPSV
jgi:putative nucleotidyltransferase with HDIG domain